MRIDYSDNSFMLSWEKVRAWYDAEGRLKDAEYKQKGTSKTTPVQARHTKVRAWLQKQGYFEAKLLNQGILKRN